MEEKSCCFIGHRTIDVSDELRNCLFSVIEDLICLHGVTFFLFGSCSKFNDLCCDVVTKLKEKYPQIKRIAYNIRSERMILDENRKDMEVSLSKLLGKKISLRGYEESITPDKMYVSGKGSYVERNQIMIDDSDYCVFFYDSSYFPTRRLISRKGQTGVWTSENSGTKIAYKYAVQKKKAIINVFKNNLNENSGD